MEVLIDTYRLLITAQGTVTAYSGAELRSATAAQFNTDTNTPVDRGRFAYAPGSTRWQVIIETSRGALTLDLPYILGHPTWTNTPEGAQACIDDLTPLIGKLPGTVINNGTLDSPVFTGIPEADTAAPGTNNRQIATTEYADNAVADHVAATDPHGDRAYTDAEIAALVIGGGAAWGGITGTLSDQTDLQAELDAKANTADLGTAAASDIGDFDAAGDATAAVSAHVGAADPHGDRAYADGLASNYDPAGTGASEAASAVAAHAVAADPHGDRAYADGLASNYDPAGTGASEAAAAIAAHVSATDPHGDRAYTDAEITALALGTASQNDTGDFDPAGAAATAETNANSYTDSELAAHVETVTVIIPNPVDGTQFLYRFQANATVLGFQIKCATGSFVATAKINSTTVTTLSQTTTSSYVAFTASGANTASAGDELNLVISASATPADAKVIITYIEG